MAVLSASGLFGSVFPPRTIRGTLALLILACTVPVVAGTTFLIDRFYQREARSLAWGTVAAARALMTVVDREIERATTTAEVLASLSHLKTDDLTAFHTEASDIVHRLLGHEVVLSDPSGRLLLSMQSPLGSAPPPDESATHRLAVVADAKPIISEFLAADHRPAGIAVAVPVLRGGEVVYSLEVRIESERLSQIITQGGLPADQIAVMVDRSGTVVARSRRSEQFVGQTAPRSFIDYWSKERAGVVETVTFDGIPAYAAFSRSELSNLTTAILIPIAAVMRDLRWFVVACIAGGLLVVAVSLGIAAMLSRRLATSISALISPALALGRGEPMHLPSLALQESDTLATAMRDAQSLMEHRSLELDRAQKDAFRMLVASDVMEKSMRLHAALFSSLRHELRRPLEAIVATTELIGSDTYQTLGLPQYRQHTASIAANSREIIGLVDQMLDYASLEASRVVLLEETVDLAADVRTVTLLSTARAELAGLRVHLAIAPGPHTMIGDRQRLRQIVLNLLSNAIKYTEPGGNITVALADTEKGDLVLTVADTGIGIAPEDVEHVLSPFGRVADERNAAAGGTGLGLTLAKRLTELHQGTLTLTSVPGQGTTVTIRFPRRRVVDSPARAAEAA